nr:hypothetical protein [Pseudomonadota bacterium]
MKIKYKILLLIILVSFVIFKLDLISDLSDLKNTASNLTPAPKFSGSIKIGIVIPLDQDYSIFQTSLEMGLKTATEYVNSQGGVINSNLTYEFIDYYKIKDLIKSNSLGSYDIFLLFGRDSTISYSITDLSHLQKPMFYIQDGKCKTVSEIEGKSPSKLVFSLGLTWEQMNEHLILHTINKLENYTKQTGVVLFGNNTKEDLTYLENITNLYKNLGIEILDAKYVDSRIIDF